MIQEKFEKINHKIIFYTEVYRLTGTSVGTIRCTWFNMTQGLKIPDNHIPTVEKCLDKCLKFEAEEKKVYEKYFKNR